MSTGVQSLKSDTKTNSLAMDAMLVLGASLFVAASAQLYVKLPFTPVPVTGQTFAVLVVGGSLGALRGGVSLLLYLGWIATGLPFASEGQGGADLLSMSSATGGYLWGFIGATLLVGWLSERGWTKTLSGAIGAMLVGSVVIYACGVTWLSAALHLPMTAPGNELNDSLEFGLYPFVVGDVLKLLLAASVLPLGRKLMRSER